MPEKGQTVFAAEQVGFTKIKKSDLMQGPVPILEKDEHFAFIFSDGMRTIIVPVNDKVRKDLVDAMRKAPLSAVTAMDNGH